MCSTETLSSRTHPRTHLGLRTPPMRSPFCPHHTRPSFSNGGYFGALAELSLCGDLPKFLESISRECPAAAL
jgi:hypothetical protein